METDLTSFIATQRRSLQNDKQDLATKISQVSHVYKKSLFRQHGPF